MVNVKRIALYSLSLLLMSCSTIQVERTELIIPVAQGYALAVSAGGYISRSENTLNISLDNITFKRTEQNWGNANPEFVEGIQIGLALKGAGDWETSIWGGMMHINKPIAAGETQQLGAFHASISLDNVVNLMDYDLILKTDIVNEAGYSSGMFSRSAPVSWSELD